MEIPIGLAISVATIAMSIGGSYFATQLSTAEKIADIRVATQANTTQVDNFENRLDRFEDKMDALLAKNGVNPAAFDK